MVLKEEDVLDTKRTTVKDLMAYLGSHSILHDETRKAGLVTVVEAYMRYKGLGSAFMGPDKISVSTLVDAGGIKHLDFDEVRDSCTEPALAVVHNWRSRYDSWFIFYTYLAWDKEYAYLWETNYDELHRAHAGVSEWYDVLQQGVCFTIKFDPADPKRHVPTARKVLKLSKPFLAGVEDR